MTTVKKLQMTGTATPDGIIAAAQEPNYNYRSEHPMIMRAILGNHHCSVYQAKSERVSGVQQLIHRTTGIQTLVQMKAHLLNNHRLGVIDFGNAN
jgi:hypothetical protein